MIGLATRAGYTVKANREDAKLARLEKSLAATGLPQPVRALAACADRINS
jgi:hypothetical protein